MKLGIITYNKPHLKTQELLFRLQFLGYKDICLILAKFKIRKERKILISHRPNQFIGFSPSQIKKKLKIPFYELSQKIIDKCDYVLIAGSNLLEAKYITKNKIINCHSGLIPQTRGLDSLKWALLNCQIVGNTLHFIDKDIDIGKVIEHRITPILQSDTIETLSLRHYNNEIDLLANFFKSIKSKNLIYYFSKKDAKKRMSFKTEKILVKNFNKIKKTIIKKQINFIRYNFNKF